MVGECLKCVKDPTNEVDMNAVAVVLTNFHCKVEVTGYENLHFNGPEKAIKLVKK